MNDILSFLRKKEIELKVDNKDLLVKFPGKKLDNDVLEVIKANKELLLAYLTELNRQSIIDSIPRTDISFSYPLSSSQRRLWVVSQFDGGSGAYHVPSVYVFRGVLDISALEGSFRELIVRHEILRTVFRTVDGGDVRQVVLSAEEAGFSLAYRDLTGEGHAIAGGVVDELLSTEIGRPFDLSSGPLLRAHLYRTGPSEWVFLCTMHHIISDGWSMGIMVKEVLSLYGSLSSGLESDLPSLELQYRDYASWESGHLSGDFFSVSRSYWLEQLGGELPVLQLPEDLVRPPVKSYRGSRVSVSLSPSDSVAFRSVLQGSGCTLFMGCLASVNGLFYRYSGQTDQVIGSPIAGREHAGLSGQLGFYANTLAFRSRFTGEEDFLGLLSQVRSVCLGGYAHQLYPFERLVEELGVVRDMGRNPLFDVMLSVQEDSAVGSGAVCVGGVEVSGYGGSYGDSTSKFDLLFTFSESGGVLSVGLEYSTDVYSDSRARIILEHLRSFICCISANPGVRLGEVAYLGAEEVDRLVYGFNATGVSYPEGESVVSLFESSAALYGDLPAVVYGDRELSYRDLDGLSNRLGDYLRREHGVGREVLVGLLLERSEWMVVAILGVLKAGGAYVPIDPGYPRSRVEYMLSDSGCRVVIDDSFLTAFRSVMGDYSADSLEGVTDGSDLAYVIYTSGSTGEPKGVMVEHGNLVNYVLWSMDFYLGNVSGGYFGVPSSLSFDLTVTSIYSGLLSGSGLYIYGDGTDTADIVRDSLRGECGVGSIKLTPSHVRLLGSLDSFKGSVGRVILGGEEVFPSDVKLLSSVIEGVSLYNEYGPTEATVGCMVKSLEPGSGVTLGLPISNTWIYILDGNMGVVPEGCLGEIYIGGAGVSRGYLNRPDLTSLRFVADPYRAGERLYRTGDLGVRLSGGEIEYRGRMDDQVKVRGYRIELGEVDRSVQRCSGILGSVTVVREVNGGDRELVSYIVGAGAVDVGALRAELGELVPSYMVPSRYVELSELPLTSNGKVDRKSLPDPDEGLLGTGTEYVGARNAVESLLVSIWEEVLGRSGIGIHDNFFILGGDSIKSIQVVSRLRQGGYGLGIQDILRFPTIFSLSGLVVALSREPFQGVETGTFGLSPIQHLFFEEIQVDRHHYNQSVMLSYDGVLLEDGIRFCLGSLMRHHDSLRYVYREGPSGWFQENSGDAVPLLDVVSIGDDADLVAHCERLQGGFSLSGGPLFRGCIFRRDEGDLLFLLCHHLVVDGVSWRILVEDLSHLYQGYVSGRGHDLPSKTDSYGYWQQSLVRYCGSSALQEESAYWSSVDSGDYDDLRVDFPGGSNLYGDVSSEHFVLDRGTTAKLVGSCYSAYRTDINDILLASLGLSLHGEFGMSHILVGLEGHGREPIGEDVDVSRTVGWFTSIYPVVLDIDGGSTALDNLLCIKERVHRVPNKGIGYGILRYLGGAGYSSSPNVVFNYLGDFGVSGSASGGEVFGYRGGSWGSGISSAGPRTSQLDFTGMIIDGELHFTVVYSGCLHLRSTVQGVLACFEGHLRSLVGILSECREAYVTPVDLSYNSLDLASVRDLDLSVGVEDLYELSPLQQGLYYHWLSSGGSGGLYFEQLRCSIEGSLDSTVLSRSYAHLVERHGVLRTFFTDAYGDRILQVVAREAVPDFVYIDSRASEDFSLSEYLSADVSRGFDLGRGSQMRLSVVRVSEDRYEFIWSHHHILMDGWCVSILVNDFFSIYGSLCRGEHPGLASVRPYSDYITWLRGIDRVSSYAYWRAYLLGYEMLSGLPKGLAAGESGGSGHGHLSFVLDGAAYGSLRTLCSGLGVTESTFFQCAWGILLGRYNDRDDVVFGTVVSGRPSDLVGVEDMVGLFINTVPVRVRIVEGESVHDLLLRVQGDSISGLGHHYVQLADIQSESGFSGALFDHIVVYENYPVQERLESSQFDFRVLGATALEQTNYGLTVVVVPGDTFGVHFHYDRSVYPEWLIGGIARHLEELLGNMVSDVLQGVSSVAYLGSDEVDRLVYGVNATDVSYPEGESVVSLFESSAALYGDLPAVVYGDRELSYRELSRVVNDLSQIIISLGGNKGTGVGVFLDRSEWSVISMLAVMKCGCIYIPMEKELPESRLSYIMAESGAALLITDTEGPEWAGSYRFINVQDLPEVPDGDAASVHIGLEDASFLLYTSGSTGIPKGVVQTHSTLYNLTMWNRLGAGLRWGRKHLQFASFGFDVSLNDVYYVLSTGGELHVASEAARRDFDLLRSYIIDKGINILYMSYSALRVFFDSMGGNGLSGHQIEEILSTGEQLYITGNLRRFLEDYPEVDIFNFYGPTETHVVTSVSYRHSCHILPDRATIGTPIYNTWIYILDSNMGVVPEGCLGEIYIGGSNVAIGYNNQSDLTSLRFVADPYRAGERLYRTGDLGVRLSGGEIEYRGRMDGQVKVRGYRIELGEVDRSVQRCSGILGSVTVVREVNGGDRELVSYIVGAGAVDVGALRAELGELVPSYMVPSRYVELSELPLTSNGKVDRKSLPDPDEGLLGTGTEYVGARNAVESLLVSIWEEVLGRSGIGIHDNFFDLGGNSLRAIRLSGSVSRSFHVQMSLQDLFLHPTVSGQSGLLSKGNLPGVAGIVRVPDSDSGYPLSSSQRRLWVVSQFDGGSGAYHVPSVYVFRGVLDISALEGSFRELIVRHEILRTVFRTVDGGDVRQVVLSAEEAGFSLAYRDLIGEGYAIEGGGVEGLLSSEIGRPFDLSSGPLLRAHLYRTGRSEWVFLCTMHHIISDGWSMGIMVKEVLSLYGSLSSGLVSDLPSLELQYRDYASWESGHLSGDFFSVSRSYWLEQLGGELPVLQLPEDLVRPAVKSYRGSRVSVSLSLSDSVAFRSVLQGSGCTLFMGCLASVNGLFYRYSGQTDQVIGSPIAGREHAGLSGQLGFYANTLAFRSRFTGEEDFLGLLSHVRSVCLGGYAHQLYPFERLVEELGVVRDMGRNPLFDVMLSVQEDSAIGSGAVCVGGVEVSGYEGSYGDSTSKFDLLFTFSESGGVLSVGLEYSTDVYSDSRARIILEHLRSFICCVSANPGVRLGEVAYLGAEEVDRLVYGFNATGVSYPEGESVVSLFESSAALYGDLPAVVYGDRELSYRDLDCLSNRLGDYLRREHGVGREVLVGLLLERSEWMVVAILGVLKAGGAYVPIDPGYPRSRVDYMLSDSGCRVVIDDSFLSDFRSVMGDYSADSLEGVIDGRDLAYVIYTSGSTGEPKGVMVEHRNVVSFFLNFNVSFKEMKSILFFTNYTFDISVLEILGGLCHGLIINVLDSNDPEVIIRGILNRDVDVVQTTPSRLKVLLSYDENFVDKIKMLIVGGELLPINLFEKLKSFGKTEIYNMYGPTETTIWSTGLKINASERCTIGRPLHNEYIYILDGNMGVVPEGCVGEIYIGGAGVSRGYLNRPDLTSLRFVADPYRAGERLYRTGDLGVRLSGGEIEYRGRMDDQVKVRGYRIELSEVDRFVQRCSGILGSVTVAREVNGGDRELVSYIVSSVPVDVGALRAELGELVPSYMVPSRYVELSELPLTSNGKVDRKSLPDPDEGVLGTGTEYVGARNAVESLLVSIWEEVLGRSGIGIHDNFFDLGGNSLRAIRLSGSVSRSFHVQMSLQDLFLHPTVSGQSGLLSRGNLPGVVGIARVPDSDSGYPLSSSQRRLWVLSQFDGGSMAYHVPSVYVFRGVLDISALEGSFRELIGRHEILRTVFRTVDGGDVRQVVLSAEDAGFSLAYRDLIGEGYAIEGGGVEGLLSSEIVRPFDLSSGPLLRAHLYRTGPSEWVFLCTMHHIISDGWSMGIMVKEVLSLYGSLSSGLVADLPSLELQYRDYASWESGHLSGDFFSVSRSYWLEQLGGELPVLQLPEDLVRPAVKSYRGSRVSVSLSLSDSVAFRSVLQGSGCTLFMGCLASVNGLFYRYSGQTDQVIGSPIAGREHAGLSGQLGFYANTLAFRSRFTGEEDFLGLLSHVRSVCLGGYAHQLYPFERLVEELGVVRDMGRNPLFDVMLSVQEDSAIGSGAVCVGGVEVSGYEGSYGDSTSKFDLLFTFSESGGVLSVGLEYSTDVYSDSRARIILEHLRSFICCVSSGPGVRLGEVAYLGADEVDRLVYGVNATDVSYPEGESVVSLFESSAALYGDLPAVVYGDRELSYRELSRVVNDLSQIIISLGGNKGTGVGVFLDRSEWSVISMLAVMKCGCIYIPMEKELPESRLSYIMAESGAALLITDTEGPEWAGSYRFINVQDLPEVPDGDAVSVHIGLEDASFLLYTSGSTGIPKGVVQTHSTLYNLTMWNRLEAGLRWGRKHLQFASFGFDASLNDVYYVLSTGGELHVVSEAARRDFDLLRSYIIDRGINILSMSYSALRVFFDSMGGNGLSGHQIEEILSTGEQLYITGNLRRFLEDYPEVDIFNFYGPTETHVVTSVSYRHSCHILPDRATIGTPIYNTWIYILDSNMGVVPEGCLGEIYIGGSNVAIGYNNQSDLTSLRFVADPYRAGERLYRTGDLGVRLSGGEIEYRGRMDGQVKVRGYRIELGEVDLTLQRCSGIRDSVTVVREVSGGDRELVSYIVGAGAVDVGALRAELGELVPSYMVPSRYVELSELPLTSNGKVDRKSLPDPDEGLLGTGTEYVGARNAVESLLVSIWEEVLEMESINIKDDFFSLGGNSLKAILSVSKINNIFNVKMSTSDIFMFPTIELQGKAIQTQIWILQTQNKK
ncbi:amino acid adenylation domain-containing protein [Sphingobacterium sp. ML3W]|uniref:non-ribosomal peptide synthetase n=1 Tax=Sphingobacterium sp. ML3W TaxID=1538644 RepID=UPI00249A34EE|nr:non-ribosomal peptide synthetase [Sphingobacterium sp. ML3W]WFA78750.1 amino acid adenylation domain-containing protein [Sphingobacterium sp. ML3W]